MEKNQDDTHPVTSIQNLLNVGQVNKGVVHAFTRFQTIRDTKTLKYYFRTTNEQQWKVVQLNDELFNNIN